MRSQVASGGEWIVPLRLRDKHPPPEPDWQKSPLGILPSTPAKRALVMC